jgi:hypothetical protein
MKPLVLLITFFAVTTMANATTLPSQCHSTKSCTQYYLYKQFRSFTNMFKRNNQQKSFVVNGSMIVTDENKALISGDIAHISKENTNYFVVVLTKKQSTSVESCDDAEIFLKRESNKKLSLQSYTCLND